MSRARPLVAPTTPARTTLLRLLAVLGTIGLVATLLWPGSADADEPRPRDRLGGGTPPSDDPIDGPVLDTTTPTLTLDQPVAGAEIVVSNLAGHVVDESGPIEGGSWQVSEGALQPGGNYQWHAVVPTGTSTVGADIPTVDRDANVSGDMGFGSQVVDYMETQAPQPFNVSATAESQGTANGLLTDFFPHFDIIGQAQVDAGGEPVQDVPTAVVPGQGSQMISSTATWKLIDDHMHFCPVEERARKPDRWQVPPEPLLYETTEATLCDLRFGIEAEATVTEAGGEAAAYNVVGTNVAPSYDITITRDHATEDGFVVSTAGGNRVSAGFPLQTEFGFRSLGYITVPESRTYTFGTQSPGGAEAFIYKTTEDELGKTRISHANAWSPTTVGETYVAQTDTFRFENRETGSSTSSDPAYNYRSRTYEYEEDDDDWIQPPKDAMRNLIDELHLTGPRADTVRWGEPVELEAGRAYPIVFTGWVGPVGGDIGLWVDSLPTGQIPVPFDWLSPAPEGTVSFDRELGSSTSNVEGVAVAMSGYGDTLAVLDAAGDLQISTTDGGYAWIHDTTIAGVAAPVPDHQDSVPLEIDVEESIGWSARIFNWPQPPGSTEPCGARCWSSGEVVADFVAGELRVRGSSVELGNRDFLGASVIDSFELWFDRDGEYISGSVEGSTPVQRTDPNNGLTFLGPDENGRVILDTVANAELSTETGDLEVVFGNDEWLPWPGGPYNSVTLRLELDEERPLRTAASSMAFDDAGNTLVAALQRPVDGADPEGLDYAQYEFNPAGSAVYGVDAHVPDSITGPLQVGTAQERYRLTAGPVVIEAPYPDEPIQIDHLDVTFDAEGKLADSTVSGTLVGGEDGNTRYELTQVSSANRDVATGTIDVRLWDPDVNIFEALRWTYVIIRIEPVEVTAPGIELDVALIDRPNPDASWSPGNSKITSLNALLDAAGIDRPSLGDRSNAAQTVHISTDGNTVAVMQPVDDGYRVVVVDREDDADPWAVIGQFPITLDAELVDRTGTAPVTVGRDLDWRYVALAEGNNISVHEWTPWSGWASPVIIQTDAAVASLSLDYFAEFLAVGQPDIGQVSIYHKPYWTTVWSHHKDITHSVGFGAQVSYTWKHLTITSANSDEVRVYRDMAWQTWDSYEHWSQAMLTSVGIPSVISGGVDTTLTRTVAGRTHATNWSRFFDAGPLGGFAELTTYRW